MDIRELNYIAMIGKTHHITQAAHELYISQPALHKTLRKVEEELGTVLFFRRGNQVFPTDTGQIVLRYAETVCGQMNRMRDEITAVKDLQQGEVSIGFPSIVGELYLPSILTAFQKKYEHITLRTYEFGGGSLEDMVNAKRIDLAITMRPVDADTLNEIPLVRDQIAAGVPEGHPWEQEDHVTIRDLAGVPFVTFDETYVVHRQLLGRFRAEDLHPTIACTGASVRYLCEMARLSGHVLVLPAPIIRSCTEAKMKILPFEPVFPWELSLVFRKNDFLSNAARALTAHIQGCFLKEKL